jgi:hypothetical protein
LSEFSHDNRPLKEASMLGLTMMMRYFFGAGILTAGITMVLVIYGNALSTREDDELYLNKAEQAMVASEQRMLIGKMHGLARVIFGFAVVAGVLLAVSAGLWVWIGFHGS